MQFTYAECIFISQDCQPLRKFMIVMKETKLQFAGNKRAVNFIIKKLLVLALVPHRKKFYWMKLLKQIDQCECK